MGSLGDFLGTFIGRAFGFGVLYGLVFLFQVWKFDLLHQETLTFLTALFAWAVIWIVSVLNAARAIGFVAGAFLLWITLSSSLPHTADAVRTRVRTLDTKAGQAIGRIDEKAATVVAPAPTVPPPTPTPATVAPSPEPLAPVPSVVPSPFQAIEPHPAHPVPDDDGFQPIERKR